MLTIIPVKGYIVKIIAWLLAWTNYCYYPLKVFFINSAVFGLDFKQEIIFFLSTLLKKYPIPPGLSSCFDLQHLFAVRSEDIVLLYTDLLVAHLDSFRLLFPLLLIDKD